jgi:hypothetical protein
MAAIGERNLQINVSRLHRLSANSIRVSEEHSSDTED